MTPIPDMIVVGTDTGVGKSVVSLLLMQLLHAKGYNPFYLKPFQTGCDDPWDRESDAAFVYRHTVALNEMNPAKSVLHCYPNPKAPFFAARDAGENINIEHVYRVIEEKRSNYSPLIVEAAGGLLVPMTQDLVIVDLIRKIDCRPLLVARAGLGTINHTLLSIEALQRRKCDLLGILFVESGTHATDPNLLAENMAAIEMFANVTVGGVIPMISDFSAPPEKAIKALENALFL